MNLNWQEFLGAAGARVERQEVSDFGDTAGELAAADGATIIAPLSHLGLIEVAGADGASFLHNQLTSDIKHLTDGKAQHSGWCSAKGRMLASFLIFRQGPELQLVLAADLVDAIAKRLQMFILRSKVQVFDRSDQRVLLGLAGPQALAALQAADLPQPADPLTNAAFADGVVIRLDERRFAITANDAAAPALWRALSAQARPVGTPAWQWLDIQAGMPLISEATKEHFVPQMVNFDRLGGVSFHKGCYPGQEVVARTQYLGKVKRHLFQVHLPCPARAGDALYTSDSAPDRPCGTITNAAPAPGGGYDALAVIQETFFAADLRLGAPNGAAVSVIPQAQ